MNITENGTLTKIIIYMKLYIIIIYYKCTNKNMFDDLSNTKIMIKLLYYLIRYYFTC